MMFFVAIYAHSFLASFPCDAFNLKISLICTGTLLGLLAYSRTGFPHLAPVTATAIFSLVRGRRFLLAVRLSIAKFLYPG
jgi:hypothetical protein